MSWLSMKEKWGVASGRPNAAVVGQATLRKWLSQSPVCSFVMVSMHRVEKFVVEVLSQ